jgi:hypothetical protein
VITAFLSLVECGIPLRAASRVLEFIARFFELPFSAPAWTTGRLWLLRFGLAQLKALKASADDWVWMIDHSVQIGKQKLLAIIAIRLVDLPMPDGCLRPEDMVLIGLIPMNKSTKEDVARRLEEAAARTSVPCAIVCDHGADVHGGIQIFQKNHPETVDIYDIKHMAACLLRARLENDPRWAEFGLLVARIRNAIQQTELGPLAPPCCKPKARYMNLQEQLNWADKMLALLDGVPGKSLPWVTPERLEEKLGGLREFRDDLVQWRQWQAIIDAAVSVVRTEGLHAKTTHILEKKLRPLMRRTDADRRLAEELISFVREQASKVQPGQCLPGTTEVLESCFGKLKTLERQQAKGGFTGLVLGFGSFFARATIDQVSAAMRAVPTKEIKQWCFEHLGQTLFSQKRQAYALAELAQRNLAESGP